MDEFTARDLMTGSKKGKKRVFFKNKFFIGLTFLCLTLFSFKIYSSYKKMELTAARLTEEKKWREEQLKFLEEQVEELRTSLDELTGFNTELQELIGLESDQGVGGFETPRINHKYYNSLLKSREEELIRDLWLDIQYARSRKKNEWEVNDALKKYFTKKSDFISSLPFGRPIKGGWISSGYGSRKDPFTGELRMHTGLDLSNSLNAPVFATAEGSVIFAEWDGDYGKTIKIDHGFGFITYYAHLNKLSVKEGARVKRYDMIGLLGNTGRSTGPHLHYEIRIEGRPVNPWYFLQPG